MGRSGILRWIVWSTLRRRPLYSLHPTTTSGVKVAQHSKGLT
jgi:hypothetical protein